MVALIAVAAEASADCHAAEWNTASSFGIYSIRGVDQLVPAGSKIVLTVVGRSVSTHVPPSPEYGFQLAAAIDHFTRTRLAAAAYGSWDDELRGWILELVAPYEPGENYCLRVHLSCVEGPRLCAETHGKSAEAVQAFSIDVQ